MISPLKAKHLPALKHALIFALGIVCASTFDIPAVDILPLLFVALIWMIRAMRDSRFLLPVALTAVVGCAGALTYSLRSDSISPSADGFRGERVEVIGSVAGEPTGRSNRHEILLRPDSILYRNSSARLDGTVLLRLYDTACSDDDLPRTGDRLSVVGTLRIPSGPEFPGAPDFRAILRRKGITATLDCYRASEIFVFGTNEEDWWTGVVRGVRSNIRRTIERCVGGEEGEIARALLLGETDGIERSTRDSFARTGTAHVLAVSGLHVGVLAMGLFVLVGWFRNRWIRLAIFGLALTGYICIVGGRPSILRASVMAFLFLLAYNAGRITRPLNTLGLAGLILLLIDPSALFDVGFQLSFAAVAGILLFYPRLLGWSRGAFPVLFDRTWSRSVLQLLLVSTCAQLATLPLTLHYFGYVSLIAPLVNLAVVPLIGIGLGSTAAAVLGGAVPLVPTWFGATARLSIGAVVELVDAVESVTVPGIETAPIGWGATGLLCAGLLYLVLSRSPMSAAVRLCSVSILALIALTADRRTDRISAASVVLAPLTTNGGIAVGIPIGDTLTMYYGGVYPRDSAAAVGWGDRLSDRMNIGNIRIVDIGARSTERAGTIGSNEIELNEQGPEIGVEGIPVIVSNTALRRHAVVALFGTDYLQISLQRRLSGTVFLQRGSDWEILEWD